MTYFLIYLIGLFVVAAFSKPIVRFSLKAHGLDQDEINQFPGLFVIAQVMTAILWPLDLLHRIIGIVCAAPVLLIIRIYLSKHHDR